MSFQPLVITPQIIRFIRESLNEDIGPGDYSSLASIPHNESGKARLIFKDEGIAAGFGLAETVFSQVDEDLRIERFIEDGARVKHGDIGFIVEGSVHSILKSERLVLNLMQRLSGIATATNKLVSAIGDLPTRILDTRKTTPGLRALEKWAVTVGGGHNHRFGLYDMVMLKDNHIDYAGGIRQAILRTVEFLETNEVSVPVEIETRNLDEVHEVLEIGQVDRIMLDNFSPATMKEAVQLINKRFETEASGGITIDTIREYAETGVDFISVGAITHSVKALDISLKMTR